jgi:hypothetical protein
LRAERLGINPWFALWGVLGYLAYRDVECPCMMPEETPSCSSPGVRARMIPIGRAERPPNIRRLVDRAMRKPTAGYMCG